MQAKRPDNFPLFKEKSYVSYIGIGGIDRSPYMCEIIAMDVRTS